MREAMATFAELKDEGIVRDVGVCNVSMEQLHDGAAPWGQQDPPRDVKHRVFGEADRDPGSRYSYANWRKPQLVAVLREHAFDLFYAGRLLLSWRLARHPASRVL
jgi:hypothetical protein